MHGFVLAELERFIETRHGAGSWQAIRQEAGLADEAYVPNTPYPDELALAMVTASARRSGETPAALIERFGAFLAPVLVQKYASLLDPTWKTLEIILNAEHTIHKVVLRGQATPQLYAVRVTSGQVRVRYASPRRLCALAKGIVRGLAGHFGERVTVSEERCMHQGSPACELTVRRG